MTTLDATAAHVVTRARLAVTAAFALNGLVFAAWVSRIPAVRDDLALSNARLGLVLLAMSLGAVLALPSTGVVVIRLGARGTVRLAAVVCTLGLAVVGLAGSVSVLVVGLFCMGLGSGSWDVAMNVEGADVERRLGRAVMPHFHGAWSIGGVFGALLGALLTYVLVPTPVHLVGTAAVVLFLAVLASRWFLPVEQAPSAASGEPRTHPLKAWLEPRTLAIGFLVLTFAFTEGSANDWLALAMIDGHGVGNAVGVLTFALFTAAMTTGRFLGTRLLDRFGRVRVLRVTALVAMAGLLLVVAGGSAPVAMIGALAWGLGASLGFPVGMSAASDEPEHSAARVSVVSSIGYTAFLAGPPAIGFLAEHVGVLESLWVVLAVLVCALALAHTVAPTARARDEAV